MNIENRFHNVVRVIAPLIPAFEAEYIYIYIYRSPLVTTRKEDTCEILLTYEGHHS